MSLIFATQLTAVATAVLAVFAIVTAAFAFFAYRAQAQEVGLLLEENRREAAERRRAQAARVFIGLWSKGIQAPPDMRDATAPSYAQNASDFPVFGAQFWYSDPDGLSGPDDLGMIMPGESASTFRSRVIPAADAPERPILTFRDAAGVRWVRMLDGAIKEQARDTARESVLAAIGETPPGPPGG